MHRVYISSISVTYTILYSETLTHTALLEIPWPVDRVTPLGHHYRLSVYA